MRAGLKFMIASLAMAASVGCGGSQPGGNPTPAPTPTPTPAPATFLYVGLWDTHQPLLGYRLDEATGALTSIATSPTVASWPIAHPRDSYLYSIAQPGSGYDLLAQRVDPYTGALASITDSMPVHPRTAALRRDPGGDFLYAFEACATLSECPTRLHAYRLNRTTGGISGEVAGSPFSTGYAADEVVSDPSGQFAYVSVSLAYLGVPSGFWGFRIDRGAGTLTPVLGSPFATQTEPDFVLFHPTRPHVFVSDAGAGGIWTLGLDQQSGTLSVQGLTPVAGYPQELATDSRGRFLYAVVQRWFASQPPTKIRVFSIDSDQGTLAPTGVEVASTSFFQSLHVHRADRLLVAHEEVSRSEANVRAYAIDGQTGGLTEVSGSPYPINGGMTRLQGIEPPVRFLPNTDWLMAFSRVELFPFQVGADGSSLTARAPVSAPGLMNFAVVQVGAR